MDNAVITLSEVSHTRQHSMTGLVKPDRASDETQAHYEWRILRTLLREAVHLVKKAELNELAVVHGIHFLRRVSHNEPLQQVLYMKETCVR
jgi:hypothetical protein